MVSASAQTAKPVDAAEAAAAMERARRQAAGPMRVILEASKARRKGTESDAPAAIEVASRPAPARQPSAAAAPASATEPRLLLAAAAPGGSTAGAARQQTGPDTQAAAVPAPASVPALAASSPIGAALLAEPEPVRLGSEDLQSKSAGVPIQALNAPPSAPLAAAPFAQPAALPAAELPVALLKPRLLAMIEPELTQRQLDQLGRNATVLIDLRLRADGSVAQVTVLPPASRQLERALAPVLEQWKFEPLPSDRVHRVELVFNPER